MKDKLRRAVDAYLDAKHAVLLAGYGPEIDWQASRSFDQIDERTFLREAAWVVLATGFREASVRRCFDGLSEAFFHWTSARTIAVSSEGCVRNALRVFNHVGKVTAIASIASEVARQGFSAFSVTVRQDPLGRLRTLPYIGPVTSLHLAKNLGFDVAKPDRHLVRITSALRFESAGELCDSVSAVVGDRVSVVDLVFWRFATLAPDYEQRLSF